MAERIDFSRRAFLEEEMDGLCSFEELRRCLQHLALVNRITRAHRPILRWLDEVANSHPTSQKRDVGHPASQNRDAAHPLRIVDVGCGYGDMLRRIERWAARRGVAVELVGVDVNAHAVRAAREATPAASRIQ